MGVVPNMRHNLYPRQGALLGRRLEVCFAYDAEHTVGAACIRDDVEEPFRTIFVLDDGRFVLSSECMYRDAVEDDPSPSLKRIALAYGAAPNDSAIEEELLGRLLRKVESDERELAETDAKLRAAAEAAPASPMESWVTRADALLAKFEPLAPSVARALVIIDEAEQFDRPVKGWLAAIREALIGAPVRVPADHPHAPYCYPRPADDTATEWGITIPSGPEPVCPVHLMGPCPCSRCCGDGCDPEVRTDCRPEGASDGD